MPIVKKAMSIAYFRRVIKQYVDEINIVTENDEETFTLEGVKEILMTTINDLDSKEFEPLRLYTIKVISQRLDIFKFEKAKDYAPWIASYRNQFNHSFKFYPITLDSKIELRNELLNFKSQNDVFQKLKQILLNKDIKQEEKFFVSSMILQFFYLNENKPLFSKYIESDLKAAIHLGSPLIEYLKSLCAEEYTTITQKAFSPSEDEVTREI